MKLRQTFSAQGFLILLAIGTAGALEARQDASSPTAPGTSTTIQLRTYLEETRIPINQTAIFHVELSWEGDLSRYQFVELPQPLLTNLLMEGSGSANRLESGSEGTMRAVKSITYQFRPVELGMAYIDGLEVEYLDTATGQRDVLQSQRLQLEVLEAVAESGSEQVRSIIYIVLLVLFSGTSLYFVMAYLRKRRQHASPPKETVPLAARYLEMISKEVDARSGNLPEMSVRLSRLLKEYLGRAYQFNALEAGTAEICDELRRAGEAEGEVVRMKEVLERLDYFKFAGTAVDPAEFSNQLGAVERYLSRQNIRSEPAAMKEA